MPEDDSEGVTFEFTARQALGVAALFGLTVGLTFGFAAGAMTFDSAQQPTAPAEDPDTGDQEQPPEEEEQVEVSMQNIDLSDRPTLGDDDAPIKIVEYSDFGCPFCAEWQGVDASPQIPISDMQVADDLKENFIDTGEVQLIHKDFPVDSLHANAPDAHTAANCVYEEEGNDAYWDFHDELYEQREAWTESGQNDPDETFRTIAQGLGLDADSVMQCYEETDNSAVQDSRTTAVQEFGNMGTPTFYIGTEGGEYIQISGAQPIDRFEDVINEVRN